MTVIYVGHDDNSPLGDNVYPLSTIFTIWLNLYKAIERDAESFVYDPSLKETLINWKTGDIVSHAYNKDIVPIYT